MPTDLLPHNAPSLGGDGAHGLIPVCDEMGNEFLELRSRTATARVALHGAQVMSFIAGGGEVLWTGPYQITPGKDCWGGIPLCWPWFMTGTGDKPIVPFHGPARFSNWSLVGSDDIEGGGVRAVLELKGPVRAGDGVEFSLDARLTLTLAESLRIELTTRNTGSRRILLEHCFHSYFRVGDVTRTVLKGLEGTERIDNLSPQPVPVPMTHPLTTNGPASQNFRPFPARLRIEDPVLGRCITLSSQAASHLVLWNSGPVREQDGRTTGEHEWRTQLALEPLRGLDKAVNLGPGQTASLDMEISVSELGEH